MACVVVIHGDPVELSSQMLLHLAHEIAGEAAQIVHLGGVFWGDDKTKLVAVLPAALDEDGAMTGEEPYHQWPLRPEIAWKTPP
jgi:hypothetical protein